MQKQADQETKHPCAASSNRLFCGAEVGDGCYACFGGYHGALAETDVGRWMGGEGEEEAAGGDEVEGVEGTGVFGGEEVDCVAEFVADFLV